MAKNRNTDSITNIAQNLLAQLRNVSDLNDSRFTRAQKAATILSGGKINKKSSINEVREYLESLASAQNFVATETPIGDDINLEKISEETKTKPSESNEYLNTVSEQFEQALNQPSYFQSPEPNQETSQSNQKMDMGDGSFIQNKVKKEIESSAKNTAKNIGSKAQQVLSNGIKKAMGAASGAVSGAMSGAASFASSIALPIMLGLIVGVIYIIIIAIGSVVLFLFVLFTVHIINTSSYVVPQGNFIADFGDTSNGLPGSGQTSRYISVNKTVTSVTRNSDGATLDKNNVKNSDLPITVEYEITVGAKRGTIANPKFKNICSIINYGPDPDCTMPVPSDILPPEEIPTVIDLGNPFVFTYSKILDKSPSPADPGFEDSYVIDTFEVTAEIPDGTQDTASAIAAVRIGNPPEDCPSDWPVVEEGEQLYVNQGPDGTYTHIGYEAIDISTSIGQKLYVTHDGVVSSVVDLGSESYGKHIRVSSFCLGQAFDSVYAHLSVVYSTSSPGTQVNKSDIIGETGNSGNSTGPHLHYEFRPPDGGDYRPKSKPVLMQIPYIPKNITRGCTGCGIPIP